MNESQVTAYCIISLLVAGIDLHVARKAFLKDNEIGRFLCYSATLAAVITVSYMLSAQAHAYRAMSLASTCYFLSIDWMLLALLHFVTLSTNYHTDSFTAKLRRALVLYGLFDTAVLVANVFTDIAISYEGNGVGFASYTYNMKPLYLAHLGFSYLLVGIILWLLYRKATSTPYEYRNQYLLQMLAIVVVIVINAVFLLPLLPGTIATRLDLSVFGYSVGLLIMYWSAFEYREKTMLESLSMTIFQNINQGIVLFDYSGRIVMHNQLSERLLTGVPLHDDMMASELHETCDVRLPQDDTEDIYSVQCYLPARHNVPLRCDYRRLRNSRREITGTLFVFTDTSQGAFNGIDLLTGFLQVGGFRTYAAENPWEFSHPTSAAVIDILGLSETNRTYGREVGDQRIRNMAQAMRKVLPHDCHCVRGHEAHLVAVCPGMDEAQLAEHVEKIRAICGERIVYGLSCTTDETGIRLASDPQAPISHEKLTALARQEERRDVIEACETASRAMKVKKLLSPSSAHSQTLTSLVRALEECDSDTEAHVKRTQRMGALLGERIGLTDAELADLQLLCLLHDIGKVGIPLDILNKPGKLTDAEWKVLRSHAEKGYQIALSSKELQSIATYILHHHERWDGKGYPQGIAGNQIPLLSRIISVVDAYDAMVNTRSYRRALTPEAAKAEVRRCAGTQFDAYLAEQFLAMLEENPELALGEKTGGEVPRTAAAYLSGEPHEAPLGHSRAVSFSRYVVDIDDRIMEVDDTFEALTGYTMADVRERGMHQIDLIPPDDQTQYLLLLGSLFSKGNSAYIEHDILRKDGSVIHVFCYGKRFFDSALKAFFSEIIVFEASSGA